MTLKFLCPECKKLVDEFYETFQEFPMWRVIPVKDDFGLRVEHTEVVSGSDFPDFISSECPEGHMFHEWRARNYIVEIVSRVDGKFLKPLGDYWKENIKEFIEITKELGYKPLVEQKILAK